MPFEHVLPAGLVATSAADSPIEERYEVQWRDDEDPAHYFFWVQVSAIRLGRIAGEALRLLPPRVHVVLEVRRTVPDGGGREGDDGSDGGPAGPEQERWVSPVVPRDTLLRVWERHGAALVHDGTVGFGAYDPDTPLEVFLDDHKLLSLFAPGLDPFESLLRRHDVAEGVGFPTILDVDHDHFTLAAIRARDPAARKVWTRRRGHDVAWFAPAIRKSLRMRRQESAATGGGAADAPGE